MVLLDNLLDKWKAKTCARLSCRSTVKCRKLASMGSSRAAASTSERMVCQRLAVVIMRCPFGV